MRLVRVPGEGPARVATLSTRSRKRRRTGWSISALGAAADQT